MTQLAFLGTEQLRTELELWVQDSAPGTKGFALGARDLWTRGVGAMVEEGLSIWIDACTGLCRDRVDILGI